MGEKVKIKIKKKLVNGTDTKNRAVVYTESDIR